MRPVERITRSSRALIAAAALSVLAAPALRPQAGDSVAPPPAAPSPVVPWSGGSANWRPALLGTQINLIPQYLAKLPAPYLGVNSLRPNGDYKMSEAYGVYTGVPMGPRLQGYLDVEMIRGHGINQATGFAGITNGDVLRQGTVDLGDGPYVARAYLRYTLPFASTTVDTLARWQDQLPTMVSSRRLEFFAGKLAVTDLIDVNRYANTTRWQFMNWSLFQNSAWDYAADTRGYSNGVAVAWITPHYSVRAASFQMPTFANGNKFDPDLRRARGDEVELTMVAPLTATTIRVLAYINHARMGSYRVAINKAAAARAAGTADSIPDVSKDDTPGRRKYGFGLNLEQPLADNGETGVFARLGWNDGENESFVFTEVDRHASAGLQLSGASWGRVDDRLGMAGVYHGIVPVHREYLAAGGAGFLLGDGALTYGPEEIFEAYYRLQIGRYVQVGPDLQLVRNPGYNRDRGTATVVSFRVNLRY